MSNLTLSQFLQQQSGNLTPALAQVIETIGNTCKDIDLLYKKVLWLVYWVARNTKTFKVKNKRNSTLFLMTILIDALKVHPHVGGLASEELDEFTPAQENGEFLSII